MMVRKGLLVVAAAVALLTAGSLSAVAAPGVPAPLAAASFQQQVFPSPDPIPLGESVVVGGAELAIDNALIEPVLDEVGMSAVRTSVTVRNVGDAPINYDADAWLSFANSSTFRLVGSNGAFYPVDREDPSHASVPGSNVSLLDPGYAGRWTVGFRVPTAFADNVAVEWVLLGQPIAAWDLGSTPSPKRSEGPDGARIAFGAPMDWSDDLVATPKAVGQLVCGDPGIEHVSHIMTVTFEVTNSGAGPVLFPGVAEPAAPATLLWADGSAADFLLETFVGDQETLAKVAATKVHIPPGATVERGLVFTTLRDARMVDLSTTPDVLVANAPAGRQLVDLSGVTPTIGIDPRFCDLGFNPGPLPYATSPGAKFSVRGEGPFADTAAQDAFARALLDRVLAGAAIYYDANNQTFEGLTAGGLARYVPGAVLNDHIAGETVLQSAIGKVYLDTDDADLIYVITESESGSWLCAATTAYTNRLTSIGSDPDLVGADCWSDVFAEEEPEPESSGDDTAD